MNIMNMKEKNLVKFADINIGEVFRPADNDLYMKTEIVVAKNGTGCFPMNALRLRDGMHVTCDVSGEYERVNAVLHIID